jgi:integrase
LRISPEAAVSSIDLAETEDRTVSRVGHSVAGGELAGQGKRTGASVRVTVHVLRRSFGRLAYHAGVPLPTIQRIYRHASIDQTLRYVGVAQDEMTEGFAVFDTHMRAGMETLTPLPNGK